MGGGLLQLVAKGADDMFLTYDPKITLFKNIYRRYTNFSKVEHRVNFPNVLTFDKSGTAVLGRLGDLVNCMYLVVELPEIILSYEPFTFRKLGEILLEVGIVFDWGRAWDDVVSLDVFREVVVPVLVERIIIYQELIVLANRELLAIGLLRENFEMTGSVLRFMNPVLVPVVPVIPKYPILGIKYKIYLDYLRARAKLNPLLVPVFGVYATLFELYNVIDGDRIQILNANGVKNIICDTAQNILYERNLSIRLVPGYQLPYIIGSIENLRVLQPSYIGDNYIVFDSMKRVLSNIPIQVTYPLSGYFNNYIRNSGLGIDLEIVANLDLDIYYKKYISEVDIIDYSVGNNLVSFDKIVSIKANLLAILSNALPNNVKQFMRILEVARCGKDAVIYGFFGLMPNIQNVWIQNNIDRNVFFYDNDYSTLKLGDYYNNWVKLCVNGFFDRLQEVVQNQKFAAYYTDGCYWECLDVRGVCAVLGEDYVLEGLDCLGGVWYTGFVPIVVVQNLWGMFRYGGDGEKGIFWDCLFESKMEIGEGNRKKYLDIVMGEYRVDGCFRLGEKVRNYLVCGGGRVCVGRPVLAHLFVPGVRCEFKLGVNDPNWRFCEELFLGGVIPVELTLLEYLVMEIALDVFCLIDNSNMPCPVDAKLTVIRVLHLYVMSFDEIPIYIIPNIDPIFYNPPPTFPKLFIRENIMNSFVCRENNNVARMSAIYNFIYRAQRGLYNCLFREKLFGTEYYRLFVGKENLGAVVVTPGRGREVGIGWTMQQSYELFVSYFYNARLGVCVPQVEPLEFMIERTNFYNICDPDDFLGKAIREIYENIFLKIYVVLDNCAKYGRVLEVRNMDLDPLLYFGSLYQMMSAGVGCVEFEVGDDGGACVKNIGCGGLGVMRGFVVRMLECLGLGVEDRNRFVGECYKALGIVPLSSIASTGSIFGFNYTSMLGPLPTKLDVVGGRVCRGVVDFLGQIKNIFRGRSLEELLIYDQTLRVCNIMIADPCERGFGEHTVVNGKGVDKIYEHFFSGINSQGTLFTDINPIGFNSAEISTVYKGFENPYSILQFVLDMMIFNLQVDNFPIVICDNEKTTLANYELYLLGEIGKYQRYLSLMVGGNGFEGSEIWVRMMNLARGGGAEFAWARYIGYGLIDEISVSIGGEVVDTHNYKWMYLDYMMGRKGDQKRGHDMMVGNIRELYKYSRGEKCSHVMYVPVQFWFCKNISQSLPMVAMQHTEVSVTVKIKSLGEVACWNKLDTFFVKEPVLNCHLLVDYIYLEGDERKRFAESKHEYLIETVQRSVSVGGLGLMSQESRVVNTTINFSNICKYLLWTVRFNKRGEANDRILNWVDFGRGGMKGFDIKFDQRDRETMKHHTYYNEVQPYEKFCSSLPKNVFLYSFALYPKLLQPSGGVNVDMIEELTIGMLLEEEIRTLIERGMIEVEVDVYGKEISVFRVMNGIAGPGWKN
ncbi:MAG: NCLDV major capsid protein [Hyperionvirus sp.]|uniref:NCLDV major capsid protein n=1 Tax=Hyperionvirus sp. TaxID=2487770 RepID=A0A3G5ABY2_9VIRU|nr:MAG: NCLDV major capsid protein [Hyperionvirus sp.]